MPSASILIKPASGNCNMRCRYCFYADHSCMLAFQGGEPTLAGLDFYEDLAEYIASHKNPKKSDSNMRFRPMAIILMKNGQNFGKSTVIW